MSVSLMALCCVLCCCRASENPNRWHRLEEDLSCGESEIEETQREVDQRMQEVQGLRDVWLEWQGCDQALQAASKFLPDLAC